MSVRVCSWEIRGTSLSNSLITHSLFCRPFSLSSLLFSCLLYCRYTSHTRQHAHTSRLFYRSVHSSCQWMKWSLGPQTKIKTEMSARVSCRTDVRLNISITHLPEGYSPRPYWLDNIIWEIDVHGCDSGGFQGSNVFIEAKNVFDFLSSSCVSYVWAVLSLLELFRV